MISDINGKDVRLAVLRRNDFHVKKFVEINEREVAVIIKEQRVSLYILENIQKQLIIEPHGVAVRSAAIGEDGNELAWPGQLVTLLSVRWDELPEAILICANAQNSESVVAYARKHKVSIPLLRLFVQEMVNAESAGVLFTINPLSGANEIVIESVRGVGKSLVDGSRQPARYYLHPDSKELLRKEGDDSQACLLPSQTSVLIDEAQRIRSLFGRKEQDIEWAIERGSGWIFINQTRDITGLTPIDFSAVRERAILEISDALSEEALRLKNAGIGGMEKDILSDQNIAELLTPHPCMKAFGLFTFLFAHGEGAIRAARNEMGYEIGAELDSGFFQLTGGQPRCSIVHDVLTYRVQGVPLSDYCRIINYYLGRIKADSSLANYPEVVLYEQDPSLEFLAELFGEEKAKRYHKAYAQFFKGIRALENSLDKICFEEFLPSWNDKMNEFQKADLNCDIKALVALFREVCNALRVDACPMFVKVARLGFFAYTRLRRLLAELFADSSEAYLNVLTKGIPLELNPNLRFNIQLAGLRQGTVSLDSICREFGHLAAHELEISVPRYHEQVELLQVLAAGISEDIFEDFQKSQKESLMLKERLVIEAGERGAELEREIAMVRKYFSLREAVKFAYLRAYDILRHIACNIERMLGWEQGLIFHLRPEEVFILSQQDQGHVLYELAKERRQQWAENRSLRVPSVIDTEHLEEIGNIEINEDGNSKTLYGVGVTNFITEGQVIVALGLDSLDIIKDIKPGMVLVTVTTDPAWSPVLALLGGHGALVTEIGGLLAHGAIYAREAEMAAVLNVPNATSILKTGMRVRVNGPQNCVEILS